MWVSWCKNKSFWQRFTCTEHEKELTRKIGAKELPHIILLIEGRIIHYKGSQISSAKILDFIRRKFPYKLVESVKDTNVDLFLDGWTDNRVRVLLFGNSDVIKLRYLTTAFKFRSRAQVSDFCWPLINILLQIYKIATIALHCIEGIWLNFVEMLPYNRYVNKKWILNRDCIIRGVNRIDISSPVVSFLYCQSM